MNESVKVSYFQKQATFCPICDEEFTKEDLLTGDGRLIAGNLSDFLRREYEPSQKYGMIYPLCYPVIVCPNCFFSAFVSDFDNVDEADIPKLRDQVKSRKKAVALLFDELDFSNPRTLNEGAASYLLATLSYEYRGIEVCPTFKRGLASLRGAWSFEDINKNNPNQNWDVVAKIFFQKARFFYRLALEREDSGEESLTSVQNFGPDVDQNYQFEGVIYLAAFLEFRFGDKEDSRKRFLQLEKSKLLLSKVFGFGKSSRDKPTPILEHARDTFAHISNEIEKLAKKQ